MCSVSDLDIALLLRSPGGHRTEESSGEEGEECGNERTRGREGGRVGNIENPG